MSLLRPTLTVGAFTLVSRITGFIRDVMIAQFLGAGMLADCFLVAFRFTNFFSQIFAEGVFPAVFVPLFSTVEENRGRSAAWVFVDQIWTVLVWSMAAFSLVMVLAMPWAMLLFAPGLGDVPGKRELAVALARITFPYFLFAVLAALLSGMLNSLGRFAAPAAAMSILNITLVAALVLLSPGLRADHALAWGTVLAGILQVLWLLAAARRVGHRPRLTRLRLTPEVKILLARIAPAALGTGLSQINMLTDTLFASLLPTGALSTLYYAERVNQLPLGVVGIAIGTALLPLLSRQVAAGDHEAAMTSQNRALEVALFLVLPAAAGLMVLAHPIVTLLFVHGQFGAVDAEATSHALLAYAMGAPGIIAVRIFTPTFFARGDTRTPMLAAAMTLAINIALNLALMHWLAQVGIALSSALSAMANALMLGVILARRGQLRRDGRLWRRLLRIGAATLIMTGGLMLLRTVLPEGGKFLGPILLAAEILAGGAMYGLVVWIFGASDVPDFLRIVGRCLEKS